MYKCNTCIYRNACGGSHGQGDCTGYKRDNEKNRAQMAQDQKEREAAEFRRIFAKYNDKGE